MMNRYGFEPLLNCQSVEELHTATAGIIKQLGYERFIYAVRVSVPLSQPFQFVFHTYPKEWWNRYCDAGYQSVDPVVLHSAKRAIPIIWDDEVFSATKAAKLWSEAKDCGLKSGVTLPVHTPGCEWGLLSLASDIEASKAMKNISGSLAEAQLMTCYLHEVVSRLVVSNSVLPEKGRAERARKRMSAVGRRRQNQLGDRQYHSRFGTHGDFSYPERFQQNGRVKPPACRGASCLHAAGVALRPAIQIRTY